MIMSLVLVANSCNKDEQLIEEEAKPLNHDATINRMVTITNEQTASLRDEIATLAAQNTKMSSEQYNGFVRSTIETYVGRLIESEPEHLENNNLQVNKVDPEEAQWSNNTDVYGGSVEQVLPAHLLARIDKLAIRLDAIVESPFYDIESNMTAGAAEIENVIQNEISDINKDITLNVEEKEMLATACIAAKSMVQPQLGFFKTLATGAELLGEDMENFRRRSFFGRLIRAVARVAIAVVAVAIVAVLIVKAAPIIAGASKFALKIKMKGTLKSVLFGVKKKVTGTIGGLPLTVKGGLYMPGALLLGGSGGVIKAALKWDTDMSLKTWYKEFELKGKVGA